jgi:hypothetical protein
MTEMSHNPLIGPSFHTNLIMFRRGIDLRHNNTRYMNQPGFVDSRVHAYTFFVFFDNELPIYGHSFDERCVHIRRHLGQRCSLNLDKHKHSLVGFALSKQTICFLMVRIHEHTVCSLLFRSFLEIFNRISSNTIQSRVDR